MLQILFALIICNKQLLIILDFLNNIDLKCNYSCYNYKKDNNFLSLNKLLFDFKETQELYRAQLKHNYKIEKSNNIINYFFQNNCNYTFIFKLN